MNIGLLSDTHDDTRNAERALADYRRRGIEQLVHCGDLISAETADLLRGFTVIYVDGNMDRNSGAIYRRLREIGPYNLALPSFEGEIAGVSIGVTHGHVADELERLIRSGMHQFVFTGHTHRRRDERIGPTRVINPGALGGLQFESRSYEVVDLGTGEVEVIEF